MELYALTISVGCSTGYTDFLGIYDTKDRAEEAMWKDMKKRLTNRWDYRIDTIEVNKNVDIPILDW